MHRIIWISHNVTYQNYWIIVHVLKFPINNFFYLLNCPNISNYCKCIPTDSYQISHMQHIWHIHKHIWFLATSQSPPIQHKYALASMLREIYSYRVVIILLQRQFRPLIWKYTFMTIIKAGCLHIKKCKSTYYFAILWHLQNKDNDCFTT